MRYGPGIKVMVLWSRFGPYHLARLRGAASIAGSYGHQVVGLEIARDTRTYDWEVCDHRPRGMTRTVFPTGRYEDLNKRQLRSGVMHALEESHCDVVAINGWYVPEARAALRWRRRHKSRRAILMSETKEDDAPRMRLREYAKGLMIRRFDTALVGGQRHADYLQKLGFKIDRVFKGYDVVDNEYFARGAERAVREGDRLRAHTGTPRQVFPLLHAFSHTKEC